MYARGVELVAALLVVVVLSLLWRSSKRRSAQPSSSGSADAPSGASPASGDTLAELERLLAGTDWSARHSERWVELVNELVGTHEGWALHGEALGALMDRWYEAHPITVVEKVGLHITDPLELDTKRMLHAEGVRPWTQLVRSLSFRKHGIRPTSYGTSAREVPLAEVLHLLEQGGFRRLESFDPSSLLLEGDDEVEALMGFLEQLPRLRHLVFWRDHGFVLGERKPGSVEAIEGYAAACRTHVRRLQRLGRAPWAPKLETLIACEVFLDWDDGPAEEALRALGAFEGLRRLDVYNCVDTKRHAEAPLSTTWTSLELLCLGSVGSVDREASSTIEVAEVFATSDQLPALRRLGASFALRHDHPAYQKLQQASFELG